MISIEPNNLESQLSVEDPSSHFAPVQVDESINNQSEIPVAETKATLPEPILPINSKSIRLSAISMIFSSSHCR